MLSLDTSTRVADLVVEITVLCRRTTAALAAAVWASPATGQAPRADVQPIPAMRTDRRAPELTFAAVLRRALDQHPLIEAARARASGARGGRRTARTLPNPVLTVWAEDVRAVGGGSPATLDRETQTYATLPLEPLFQRWPNIRRSEAGVRAADADLARARQTVALDAARAFYRVAAAQVAVGAADDIGARLVELVAFNRARVGEGVAAEADLIRMQLELDRVAANATLDRVELARARAELAPYLGRGAGTSATLAAGPGGYGTDSLRVVIDDDVGGSARALPSLAETVTRARTVRPDLIASRARAAAARAEVTAQRALAVRQVGATLGTKRRAGVTSLLAGVSVPLPLFDQNRGEVQRAAGERSAAEQELAWAERQAVAEIGAALESVRLLTEQTGRLRGSFLPRAEESRRIALAAYREGAATLLQVLDASRALADARLAYYRTVFAQRQSLLELDAAVGADPLDRIRASTPPIASAAPASRPSPHLPPSRPVRRTGDRP